MKRTHHLARFHSLVRVRGGKGKASMATLVAFTTVIAFASPSSAQNPQGTAQAPAATPAATPAMQEAQTRYAKALELFNEGSYDAAMLEFRRAYQLAPSYRILYNIGLVNVQLNDYTAALDGFEKYLSEGGNQVPPSRAVEVKGRIEQLRAKVAELTITTNVSDAEVSIDDMPVGRSPLSGPVRVNAGRRKVSVTAAGMLPIHRVLELVGGDKQTADFPLQKPTGKTVVVREEAPSKPIPWALWGVTGALAAGAIVTGVVALSASNSLDQKRDEFGATSDELDKLKTRTTTFSVLADGLGAAALVAGGVSLYFTLKAKSESKAAPTGQQLGFGFSNGMLRLKGTL